MDQGYAMNDELEVVLGKIENEMGLSNSDGFVAARDALVDELMALNPKVLFDIEPGDAIGNIHATGVKIPIGDRTLRVVPTIEPGAPFVLRIDGERMPLPIRYDGRARRLVSSVPDTFTTPTPGGPPRFERPIVTIMKTVLELIS